MAWGVRRERVLLWAYYSMNIRGDWNIFSRMNSLPQEKGVAASTEAYTVQTVGAGLLAKAACQSPDEVQADRIRQQAGSHREIASPRASA